jgi:hypothetical protein
MITTTTDLSERCIMHGDNIATAINAEHNKAEAAKTAAVKHAADHRKPMSRRSYETCAQKG